MTHTQARSRDEIARWLVSSIAALVKAPGDTIDVEGALTDYLTDSRDALTLAADLQDWLGREVSVYIVWDHPTIAALADHLATESHPSEQRA